MSSANRRRRQDFPTPLSPIRRSLRTIQHPHDTKGVGGSYLNRKSYSACMMRKRIDYYGERMTRCKDGGIIGLKKSWSVVVGWLAGGFD